MDNLTSDVNKLAKFAVVERKILNDKEYEEEVKKKWEDTMNGTLETHLLDDDMANFAFDLLDRQKMITDSFSTKDDVETETVKISSNLQLLSDLLKMRKGALMQSVAFKPSSKLNILDKLPYTRSTLLSLAFNTVNLIDIVSFLEVIDTEEGKEASRLAKITEKLEKLLDDRRKVSYKQVSAKNHLLNQLRTLFYSYDDKKIVDFELTYHAFLRFVEIMNDEPLCKYSVYLSTFKPKSLQNVA